MFEFARAILLFGLFVSTITAAELHSLKDLKSVVQSLEEGDVEDDGAQIERQLSLTRKSGL